MKFCKDCRHIRDAHRESFEKCAAEPPTTNPVTGEPKLAYCSDARTISWGACGPEGKLWETMVLAVVEHEAA